MASEVSTIQSLKAVDAWIDVINANINGGVRTAFKTSRLKFAGSNTDVVRGGTTSTLPLEFPEPSLITANTIIDFSQGAITTSTETSHLAIQGDGFFMVADPNTIDMGAGLTAGSTLANKPNARFFLTRDGEFHTNSKGLLVNSSGYVLVTAAFTMNAGQQVLGFDTTAGLLNSTNCSIRAVFNDLDTPVTATTPAAAVKLTDFIAQTITTDISGGALTCNSTVNVTNGMQNLAYTSFGSTIYDFGFKATANATAGAANVGSGFNITGGTTSDATVLSKSLEASNSSMTQSVPELSLAQKLFSALTKVIQIHQTNTDAVINLIR